MTRFLLVTATAITGAGLFILFREHAVGMHAASLFGTPAPVAGLALAFPAVYLIWENHDA